MTHVLALYILPLAWIASSAIALWYAWPVLRRFRQMERITAGRRQSDARTPERRLRHRIARIELRTRLLVAVVPVCFALLGISVLVFTVWVPRMIVARLVTTILLFIANLSIAYKFWAEQKDYQREEDLLSKEQKP